MPAKSITNPAILVGVEKKHGIESLHKERKGRRTRVQIGGEETQEEMRRKVGREEKKKKKGLLTIRVQSQPKGTVGKQ
jgi:hypothetical protein